MEMLFGKTMKMLSSVLDFRAARHKVILSNIVNIDTPGYSPANLSFGAELQEAMQDGKGVTLARTNEKHLPLRGEEKGDYQMSSTGERVTLDTEMVNLSENHLMYNYAVELMTRKFRSLNTVLKETR